MADLFGASDSDSGDVGELKLNEDYAKNYNRWREKEELQKLKDKYGDNVTLDSSSSSSESEDEDAEELTPALEKKFLETLSALKSKDPKIYDKDTVFFEPTGESSEQKKEKEKKKKVKPMFLKDYERKVIVEKQGVLSDDEDDGAGSARNKKEQYATPAEEEQLKRSFKAALADSDDDDEDSGGSLLKTTKQTKERQDAADEEYRLWLKGEVNKIQHSKDAEKLGYLRSYWNSSNLEKSEEFLRDYILNKRYLEKNKLVAAQLDDQEDLSADEATLEEQEVFEHKFNYRFEEPDSEFIKKYPRTMQDSMRRKDDRRKVKRQEVRERKLQEKEQKREEINRLKALKKKEILEKLERLKEVTGNDEVGFADADIEGDFDPQEHDRRMNAIFNKEYYEQEAEDMKPEDPVDEELGLEDWDQWQGGEDEGAEGDGEGEHDWTENGDSYPGDLGEACYDEGESECTDEMKGKGRKKSHFAKVVSKKKPVFDPSSKSFEEYFDEYYKLDFEDIVGGMPTRFRYRSVVPNDFGLTVEEILSAKDKELNRWCSVKKTCQYRTENEEMQDYRTFQARASNSYLKRKIFPSLYGEEIAETNQVVLTNEQESGKKRRRRKKKRGPANDPNEKQASETTSESLSFTETPSLAVSNATASGRKKRKRKISTHDVSTSGVNSHPETSVVHSDASEPLKKLSAVSEKNALNNTMQSVKTDSSAKLSLSSVCLEKSSIDGGVDKDVNMQTEVGPELSASRKKRKKKAKGAQSSGPTNKRNTLAPAFKVSANRLKAYGLNPKKVQKQLIYGKKKTVS